MSRVFRKRQHKAEPKQPESKRFNVLQISIGMECSRETVKKRMASAGIEASEYTLKQIVTAFAGDYVNTSELAPKDRLALAQAIKVERENAEAERETVRLVEVEKIMADKYTLPIHQWIIDQPERLSVRCNADHPEIAKMALTQDGDEILRKLREKLST